MNRIKSMREIEREMVRCTSHTMVWCAVVRSVVAWLADLMEAMSGPEDDATSSLRNMTPSGIEDTEAV